MLIEDSYFEIDKVPLRYKYIDRGYDKTLVVLQSSGVKWTDEEMYSKHKANSISEYTKFVMESHRKYDFFRSFDALEYNLMFVQDNYNNGYDWYLLHNNRRVDREIASGIDYVYNQDKEESI